MLPPSDVEKHVLVSVNPKAGRRSSSSRVERLTSALRRSGFLVEIHTDLCEISRRANDLFTRGRLRAVVGVGGDGTAAELTNRTIPGVPITLLPTGTANLIAKYLRLPFKPEKTAELIANGEIVHLDAGLANNRLFLVMASVGIDADVVKRVHAAREKSFQRGGRRGGHISYLSYLLPIANAVRSYRFPRVVFEAESATSGSPSILGEWFLLFNLPKYGLEAPFVPRCRGDDGLLDYCVFKKGGLPGALLGVVCARLFASHRLLPYSELGRGARFRLSAEANAVESSEIPYQLDGDPCGTLPVEISTLSKRFTTLVSPQTATRVLGMKLG